jgi:Tfp pilus assembly protein PilZ
MASGSTTFDLTKQKSALLFVAGQHFVVDIVGVTDDTVQVSFPGEGYPVEGMHVDIEFHDTAGCHFGRIRVLECPVRREDPLILERPGDLPRRTHRVTCRVPTDLTVQIKDQRHPRRHTAAMVNLSYGGALLQTDAPFDFSTQVEMTLSLPGEPQYNVSGHVAYIMDGAGAQGGRSQGGPVRQFGIRFHEPEPEVRDAISRYVVSRLQTLYPSC